MPTTEQQKPAAKPRQRSRKADQQKDKGEQKTQLRPDQASVDRVLPDTMLSDLVSPDPATPAIEAAPNRM